MKPFPWVANTVVLASQDHPVETARGITKSTRVSGRFVLGGQGGMLIPPL